MPAQGIVTDRAQHNTIDFVSSRFIIIRLKVLLVG